MATIAIIPARFASSRLPGKPLADIDGKPMVVRVWERCLQAGVDRVVVATDDDRIMACLERLGAETVLTPESCRSGTERCAAALQQLEHDNADVIINVQGDEPFLPPSTLALLSGAFLEQNTQVATLAVRLHDNERLFHPNTPKVLLNARSEALYFSRHPLPYVRDHSPDQWIHEHPFYKHIGVYAYRASTLRQIAALSPTALEVAESLEQLRWLYHGYTIKVLEVAEDTFTVDTPEDLERARLHAKSLR
ncbi:MAG: 3-deoxy-manno-octulosonate cytidylyltransferase [Bacteroidetes bacterium]|nr:3-deoxy-manno-octulosonate cytidylyltransferase [Bacteroidota bacterium]